MQISNAKELETGTKQLAAELLVSLCEAGMPGLMRKIPNLGDKLFETMMNFMLDIEVRYLFMSKSNG